jgi:hypothetical protein
MWEKQVMMMVMTTIGLLCMFLQFSITALKMVGRLPWESDVL